MGNKKKNKKSGQKQSAGKAPSPAQEKEQQQDERIITMKALQEMSDDSDTDEESLPPESEWDASTKALRDAIEGGAFEGLLRKSSIKKKNQDGNDEEEESIEEVVLGSSDEEDDEGDKKDARKESKSKQSAAQENSDDDEDDSDDDDGSSDSDSAEEEEQSVSDNNDANNNTKNAETSTSKKKAAVENEQDQDESDSDSDSDDDSQASSNSDAEDDKQTKSSSSSAPSPQFKGLAVVTQELQAAKRHMPWVETFTIVPKTPLPFESGTEAALDIHDDLKREVAFYDMALEAVQEAKAKCEEAKVPFTRPDDFFAEMVKTDEHMTRIKDRLIFEGKKMDAVAQRKSNKEQKLRAKEAHSKKLMEKAKRKKDHFKAVEDWAASAQAQRGNRGGGVDDEAYLRNMNSRSGEPNNKRMRADKKFGFGGKRGRFKQTDPSSLNDMSSFNRKGNFAQGMKKSPSAAAAGGKRPGKRARDASRSRRN